jgi:hypothetical protein
VLVRRTAVATEPLGWHCTHACFADSSHRSAAPLAASLLGLCALCRACPPGKPSSSSSAAPAPLSPHPHLPCAAQFVAKTEGGKRTVAGVHWDYDGYGATLKKVCVCECVWGGGGWEWAGM